MAPNSLQCPALDFVVCTGESGDAWQSSTSNTVFLPWTFLYALDLRTQWGEEEGSGRHTDEVKVLTSILPRE